MAESKVISIRAGVPSWRLLQFVKQTDTRKRPEAARAIEAEMRRRAGERRELGRAA